MTNQYESTCHRLRVNCGEMILHMFRSNEGDRIAQMELLKDTLDEMLELAKIDAARKGDDAQIYKFPEDPLKVLKQSARTDKVIGAFFDNQGQFRLLVSPTITYMELLFAIDTMKIDGERRIGVRK